MDEYAREPRFREFHRLLLMRIWLFKVLLIITKQLIDFGLTHRLFDNKNVRKIATSENKTIHDVLLKMQEEAETDQSFQFMNIIRKMNTGEESKFDLTLIALILKEHFAFITPQNSIFALFFW